MTLLLAFLSGALWASVLNVPELSGDPRLAYTMLAIVATVATVAFSVLAP